MLIREVPIFVLSHKNSSVGEGRGGEVERGAGEGVGWGEREGGTEGVGGQMV